MITLKFRLELKMKAGGVYKTFSRKARVIRLKIGTMQWQTAKLRVSYLRDGKELGTNEGVYHDLPSALLAWEAFTDPDLIAA